MDFSIPVINEVRIVGSRCGPFRPALEALALGNIDVRPMVSKVVSLEEGLDAFARAAASDNLKVLLQIEA